MFEMPRSATGPFIRSPSRSDENASFVRATPRSAAAAGGSRRTTVCAYSRGLPAQAPAVLLRQRGLAAWRRRSAAPGPATPLALFCTVPTITPSAPSCFQRSSGNLIDRRPGGMRPVGVARNQVELPLEVQVVPQHLADGLRGGDGLRVVRQRDEVRHGVLRRQTRAGR